MSLTDPIFMNDVLFISNNTNIFTAPPSRLRWHAKFIWNISSVSPSAAVYSSPALISTNHNELSTNSTTSTLSIVTLSPLLDKQADRKWMRNKSTEIEEYTRIRKVLNFVICANVSSQSAAAYTYRDAQHAQSHCKRRKKENVEQKEKNHPHNIHTQTAFTNDDGSDASKTRLLLSKTGCK